MPNHNSVINILRYRDNVLQYSTDYTTWEDVTPETITALPKPGELVVWIAGKNVDRINAIRLDSGTELFSRPPRAKFGGRMWVAKLKEDAQPDAEAKYDVFFSACGKEHEMDPVVKVKSGSSGPD